MSELSMVERVALALGTADSDRRSGYHDLARAAIAAMREPTQTMVYTANRLNHPRDDEVWRTMIDTALEQPNG